MTFCSPVIQSRASSSAWQARELEGQRGRGRVAARGQFRAQRGHRGLVPAQHRGDGLGQPGSRPGRGAAHAGHVAFGPGLPVAGVGERQHPAEPGHRVAYLLAAQVRTEIAGRRLAHHGQARARGDALSLSQTSDSWPPTLRFHGGRRRSSRLRSSHAASWAESQTAASTRAMRATIGAR